MERVHCIICGSEEGGLLFAKESSRGELFDVVTCPSCGLEYVSPRPTQEEIASYYAGGYFTTRTDRGYDNYFSEQTEAQITRVLKMNLRDLVFFSFEERIAGERRCLDIGCAAGYSVRFMKERGWRSMGIDVSKECVDFARRAGLEVDRGDYLLTEYDSQFDLITLWATIEHLHRPDLVLEKAHRDLVEGGRLYLSTCRTGGLNFKRLFGRGWRFYNVPEHLFYFSRKTMERLLGQKGFFLSRYVTYGSGFGKPGSFLRRGADFLAKNLSWGDMMLVTAEKRG